MINNTGDISQFFDFFKERNVKSILDIGANVGNFSMMMRHILPDVYLYMIEANPFCDGILKKTQIPYSIVCLSDVEKDVQFYFQDGNMIGTGSSYYLENTNYFSMKNYSWVTTQTLDSVLERDCSNIVFDFVKMDTQGSELDIMRGGQKTISNAKYVLLEISLIPYNIGAPLKEEVMEYMKSISFVPIEKIDESYMDGKLIQEDWIFERT